MCQDGPDIPGLTAADNAVFTLLCKDFIARDELGVDAEKVAEQVRSQGITSEAYAESIEQLEEHHYIQAVQPLGEERIPMNVLFSGFERYLRAALPNYTDLIVSVAREIVARDTGNANVSRDMLAGALRQQKAIIGHILRVLEQEGKITLWRLPNGAGEVRVMSVTVTLKREYGEPAAG